MSLYFLLKITLIVTHYPHCLLSPLLVRLFHFVFLLNSKLYQKFEQRFTKTMQFLCPFLRRVDQKHLSMVKHYGHDLFTTSLSWGN